MPIAQATPDERLRHAFAQLMMQGQGKAPLPVEGLWQQQAARQALLDPPKPPIPLDAVPSFDNQNTLKMPQVATPPGLDFPTADPSGSQLATLEASKPFPGAQSVEIVKPGGGAYALPKSPSKKKPRKDGEVESDG